MSPRSTGMIASSLSDKVAVTLVPTQHWTARGLFDRNKALWGGYVIETPAGRIYHVTDTGYHDTLFTRDARPLRAVRARDHSDRRLRAALVHARASTSIRRRRCACSRIAAHCWRWRTISAPSS